VKLLWYCEKSNVLVFNTVALGNSLDLETEHAEALGEIMHCRSDFCARNACVWWRASSLLLHRLETVACHILQPSLYCCRSRPLFSLLLTIARTE
jgi:hypothetical protein